jgi:RNA polymerase sigma-70 factor (ECF subfamily)
MEQSTIPRPMSREQLLIERAQTGDRQAFEELVFAHDRQVLRFVLHMLGNRDDARDAYQETFMKAFDAIGRFRGQSSFHMWIMQIATNVCFQRLKDRRNSRQETKNCCDNRIKQALGSLSNRERVVFELKHKQGLKVRQIAEVIGSTEDAVKNCLVCAVNKLREQVVV